MLMTSTTLPQKVSAIFDLIRLSRQYGTLLLLAPTLWSLFLAADGAPPVKLVVIFTLGTFLMRSAGCAINDIADRDLDRFVERTRIRPLASGRLSVKEAIGVFITLSGLAFVLVLFLNPLTITLSFVAILLASLYPFIKRVSHLPQVFLGVAFGWGAVMAWSAVKGAIELPAILILLANTLWSTAYDTIYAMMDIDDDIRIGVKSTAILFGRYIYWALTLLYLSVWVLLYVVGLATHLGPIYYTFVALATWLSLYGVLTLKRVPTRETAFTTFVSNVVVGAIILLGIVIDLNWPVGGR